MFDRRRLLGLAAALTLSAALSAALGACASGPTIRSDHDPSADFAAFRTYTWAATNVQPGINPLTWQRVRDGIDANLQSRGYVQGEPADFAVGFTVGRRDRIETWNYGPYYSGWGRWGGMGWYGGGGTEIRQITEGTLQIDIFDVKTQRPVWTGTATQDISGAASAAQIHEAVNGVLAKFPPGAATAK